MNRAIRQILFPSLESQVKRILSKYPITVFDPSPATCYSDSALTTPALQDGVVGGIKCSNGTSFNATQSTLGYKPILRKGAKNLLLNSASLSTQNITSVALAYTLQFTGTGTVTLSGTYSGSLVGTGANNLVTLTFTPTAGTLTLTVSGSVTLAMLKTGSNASTYVATTTVPLSNGIDPWWLDFDGVDDRLQLNAVPFQMSDNQFVLATAKTLLSSSEGELFSINGATGTPIVARFGLTNGNPIITYRDDSAVLVQITTNGSNNAGKIISTSARKTNQIVLRKNTVPIGNNATVFSTTTVTTAMIGATGFATILHSGAIYNIIFGKVPILDSELKILEKYYAKKAGLYL